MKIIYQQDVNKRNLSKKDVSFFISINIKSIVMAHQKFYKVTTPNKSYKLKAIETNKGLFGGRIVWKLYSASYTSIFPTYSFIGDCEDINRIGEAIRIAIPNCTKIEVINY